MRHTPDAVHVLNDEGENGGPEVGRVPGRGPRAGWRRPSGALAPDESGGGGRSSEQVRAREHELRCLCVDNSSPLAIRGRTVPRRWGAFRGVPRDPPGGLWQRLSAPRGPSPPDGRPPRRVFRWKGVRWWPTGNLRGFRRSRGGMGNSLDRLAPRLSPSPPPLTPEIGFGEYGVPKY